MENTLELKDFISKTLEDICLGIKDAQGKVSARLKNYPIAPAFVDGESAIKETAISFDIAGTDSTDAKNAKVGAAKIAVVSASINKENAASNISMHRIQFSVPFYPQALNYKERKRR
jgi:hypothetical protein